MDSEDVSQPPTDVEHVLGKALGGRVRLAAGETLGSTAPLARSSVSRHRVLGGPSGAPASVIVKRASVGEGESYDPDSAASAPARRLLNEWAGLQFLDEVAGHERLAPRVLGGDRARGFIVLEDLGAGTGLHEALLGSDPSSARAALRGYAAVLGRMHARTAGRVQEYARHRAALGPTLPEGLIESTAAEAVLTPERQAAAIKDACAAAGVTPAPGLDSDLATVAARWTAPGPFLTYTHGDPCPDNCLWQEPRARLLDFEFGGFSHALTDAVYGHLLFPSCWCVGHLPVDVQREMEAVCRAELGRAVPEALDERAYRRGLVEACAYWVTGMCYWAFPTVLTTDDRWGTATWRQRVLLRLRVLSRAAEEAGYLEALGATAAALKATLCLRWAGEVEDLLPYPAFVEPTAGP